MARGRQPSRRVPPRAPVALDGDELARRVEEARSRVRDAVPDLDEQTLVTILTSLLRPFGTGKRFLLKRRDGGGFVV
jgi:hypothetical protein